MRRRERGDGSTNGAALVSAVPTPPTRAVFALDAVRRGSSMDLLGSDRNRSSSRSAATYATPPSGRPPRHHRDRCFPAMAPLPIGPSSWHLELNGGPKMDQVNGLAFYATHAIELVGGAERADRHRFTQHAGSRLDPILANFVYDPRVDTSWRIWRGTAAGGAAGGGTAASSAARGSRLGFSPPSTN